MSDSAVVVQPQGSRKRRQQGDGASDTRPVAQLRAPERVQGREPAPLRLGNAALRKVSVHNVRPIVPRKRRWQWDGLVVRIQP